MILLGFAENSIQLVPDGTIFLHIAIILLMVAILNLTLFRPINRVLAERERRTQGGTGEAQDILRRVAASMNGYERSLRDARAEGYRLLEQERSKALLDRQTQITSLRAEIEFSVEEQKKLLDEQSQQARTLLETDALKIAENISNQILNRPSKDFTLPGVNA